MKRDKLDDLLRDKLGGVDAEPPADMWAKINAGLSSARRADAFGDDVTQDSAAAAPLTDEGGNAAGIPVTKIRRPQRRKMSWAYVAASVAACAMFAGIFYNYDKIEDAADKLGALTGENTYVEDKGPAAGFAEYDSTDTATATAVENVKGDGDRTLIASSYLPEDKQPGVVAGYNGTDTAGEEGYNDTTGTVTDSDSAFAVTAKKQPEEGYPDIRKDGAEPDSASAKRDAPEYTRYGTASGVNNKKRGEYAVSSFARAETGRRSRRATPVSASVFAANGGLTGSSSISGAARIASRNSLMVSETDGLTNYSTPVLTEKLKHDYPLTFGVSVGIGLIDNLSVETGIMYTYMKSEAEIGGWGYEVKQKLHYLGIPVKLKYDFFTSRRIGLYASAGMSFEKLVSGNRKWITKSQSGTGESMPKNEKLKVGHIQTSFGANIGTEIKIDDTFGIYLEPGVGYYIKNDKQPESYRTENPLNFTLRAGFRINL